MPPPRLKQSELDKAKELYNHAVDVLKLQAMGSHVCTGRKSALQWVADELGVSRDGVKIRITRALSDLARPEARSPAIPADLNHLPQSVMVDHLRLTDATVLAFSDAHWTHAGQARSVAHEALLRLAKHLKPTHLLSVGDLMDLARISKHPRRRQYAPPHSVETELTCAGMHLSDLRAAAPDAECWWIKGNHDDRLEVYLASQADALEGMAGTTLEERFPAWQFAHRLKINDDCEVIHVWHRGIHAAKNNARESGKHFITGDTHALNAVAHTIGGQTRWGIELGMLANPEWPAFHYMNGMPTRWGQGFAVLTWRNGQLLPPEIVRIDGREAWFRNQLVLSKTTVKAGSIKA